MMSLSLRVNLAIKLMWDYLPLVYILKSLGNTHREFIFLPYGIFWIGILCLESCINLDVTLLYRHLVCWASRYHSFISSRPSFLSPCSSKLHSDSVSKSELAMCHQRKLNSVIKFIQWSRVLNNNLSKTTLGIPEEYQSVECFKRLLSGVNSNCIWEVRVGVEFNNKTHWTIGN